MLGRASAKAWSRRFTIASAGFLVCWQAAALSGVDRRVTIWLALHGFVYHVIFGKAYLLVPSYFQGTIPPSRLPGVHLSLSVAGTLLMAVGALQGGPAVLSTAGAVSWWFGLFLFCLLLASRVGELLDGRCLTMCGLADLSAERAALRFVPIALGYQLLGSYGLLARYTPAPLLVDGYLPRSVHLLAAGGAALLLFALGTQLLSRFTGTRPPPALVAVVLLAGAIGPGLLAAGLGRAPLFELGAVVEATAVVGFAFFVGHGFVRASRRRVGVYGVFAGSGLGVPAVALALTFPVIGWTPTTAGVHRRLVLVGFLGLTIIGFAYLFYAPSAGRFPGGSDRTALASIALLAGGLVVESVGRLGGRALLAWAGTATVFAGACLYATLITRLLCGFRRR